MNQNKIMAYCLLAFGQISIGLNVTVGKYALQEMPVYLFLGVRFLGTAICLSLIAWWSKTSVVSKDHPTGKLQLKDWLYLTAQGFTGGFLFNFLFFWGLDYTTAVSAGIISSTLPMMIAICAYFFLKEQLSKRTLMAIGLAMSGIVVIAIDNFDGPDTLVGGFFGDFLILLAIVPEALYSIFNKFIGLRVTPLGSGALVSWLIFLMILPLTCLTFSQVDLLSYSWVCWGCALLTSFSSAFFFWAWPKGLQTVPASHAGIFGGLLPVTTAVLAYFLLGESFSWYDAGGMVLVFASLVVATQSAPMRRATKSATRLEPMR